MTKSFILTRLGLAFLIFIASILLMNSLKFNSFARNKILTVFESTLSTVAGKGVVKYYPLEPKSFIEFDILARLVHADSLEVAMSKARKLKQANVDVKSYEYKYNSVIQVVVPLLFFFALLLATPIGIKPKIIALLLGKFIWFIYIWIDFRMRLLNQFQKFEEINLFPSTSFKHKLVLFYPKLAPLRLDMMLLLATLIWIVLVYKPLKLKYTSK